VEEVEHASGRGRGGARGQGAHVAFPERGPGAEPGQQGAQQCGAAWRGAPAEGRCRGRELGEQGRRRVGERRQLIRGQRSDRAPVTIEREQSVLVGINEMRRWWTGRGRGGTAACPCPCVGPDSLCGRTPVPRPGSTGVRRDRRRRSVACPARPAGRTRARPADPLAKALLSVEGQVIASAAPASTWRVADAVVAPGRAAATAARGDSPAVAVLAAAHWVARWGRGLTWPQQPGAIEHAGARRLERQRDLVEHLFVDVGVAVGVADGQGQPQQAHHHPRPRRAQTCVRGHRLGLGDQHHLFRPAAPGDPVAVGPDETSMRSRQQA